MISRMVILKAVHAYHAYVQTSKCTSPCVLLDRVNLDYVAVMPTRSSDIESRVGAQVSSYNAIVLGRKKDPGMREQTETVYDTVWGILHGPKGGGTAYQ